MALSTTEAEHISTTDGIKEALLLKGLVEELGICSPSVMVYYDNQGCIFLLRNLSHHERSNMLTLGCIL